MLLIYHNKGPILFSALYSWTCKQSAHGIVNSYLTFYILGIIAFSASFLLLWVSPSTNVEKGSLVEKLKRDSIVNPVL